jgi:hypothetical protein
MMQDLGAAVPLVWIFVLDFFPHLPQNIAIEFSIHRLSWWNKFLMHNAFNVKLCRIFSRSGGRSSRMLFIIA